LFNRSALSLLLSYTGAMVMVVMMMAMYYYNHLRLRRVR
jgi:hypothetical protein